jgi:hypothetical protein
MGGRERERKRQRMRKTFILVVNNSVWISRFKNLLLFLFVVNREGGRGQLAVLLKPILKIFRVDCIPPPLLSQSAFL